MLNLFLYFRSDRISISKVFVIALLLQANQSASQPAQLILHSTAMHAWHPHYGKWGRRGNTYKLVIYRSIFGVCNDENCASERKSVNEIKSPTSRNSTAFKICFCLFIFFSIEYGWHVAVTAPEKNLDDVALYSNTYAALTATNSSQHYLFIWCVMRV